MTEQNASCGGGAAASNIQKILMESSLSKIRHKILVMSGKGGVGKSSISANLAVSLSRRGFKTGLMDVDLHGPSIAGIMGINGLLDITEDKFIIPKSYSDNLTVVSMQSLMPEADQAVIFRGPAKTGVIRKFIGDVQWGNLDFLVIDAPPGTGDEPLSVAQSIADARALIITTPQDVALSDVRKSINFCRAVQMDMLGLLENMGPFPCPCCGKTIEIFKSGGGIKTAKQMGIEFLGTLPFDPLVVKACDAGNPDSCNSQAFRSAFDKLTEIVMQKFGV
ncbi:MAG: Mrp/NBP35 family ATP-binding protein [Desulfobacteraceae bacterium]|nr:Mrp/NBP35 family ATP-binding protein [Desulfobacteraceae bacterium]